MNGLEFNKISAAILIAGLLAMFSGTLANIFYAPEIDPEKRGYKVEVAEAGDAGAKEEVVIDLGTLLANADVEAGKKLSKKCTACHGFEKGGANKVGPNLWGIVGQDIAANASFAYSKAAIEMDGSWDYEKLYGFINNPRGYMKGTKMAFAGIKKPEQLANLMAWMNTMTDKPANFPKPNPPAPVEEENIGDISPQAGFVDTITDALDKAADMKDDASDAVKKIKSGIQDVMDNAPTKNSVSPL